MITNLQLTNDQLKALIAEAAGCSMDAASTMLGDAADPHVGASVKTNLKGAKRLDRIFAKHGVQA